VVHREGGIAAVAAGREGKGVEGQAEAEAVPVLGAAPKKAAGVWVIMVEW